MRRWTSALAVSLLSLAVAPALYSFSDLYRFTVGRAPVGVPPSQSAGEAPVHL